MRKTSTKICPEVQKICPEVQTPGDTVTERDTIKVTVRDTIYIDKPRLLGDLDSNGIVDFADFLLFVANFGKT